MTKLRSIFNHQPHGTYSRIKLQSGSEQDLEYLTVLMQLSGKKPFMQCTSNLCNQTLKCTITPIITDQTAYLCNGVYDADSSLHKQTLLKSRSAQNMHISIIKLIFQSIWITRVDLLQQQCFSRTQWYIHINDIRNEKNVNKLAYGFRLGLYNQEGIFHGH